MPRYAATQHAIEKGLEQTAPAAGAKLLDDWIAQLEGVDKPGVKRLAGDLAKLKTELERPEPRGDKVLALVHKLGQATVKSADAAEGANADKLRALGEALTNAGTEHAEDEEAND